MPMTPLPPRRCARKALTAVRLINPRSEEHTSELQSQSNLVCRLLLEKKKKKEIARTRFNITSSFTAFFDFATHALALLCDFTTRFPVARYAVPYHLAKLNCSTRTSHT